MQRQSVPPPLDSVAHDTLTACRHSLLHAGRLLDYLSVLVPDIRPKVDQTQAALDGVFEHLLALPKAIPRTAVRDRPWTRDEVVHALDRLVEAPEWEHPSHVLSRPRPDEQALLDLCEEQLTDAEEPLRTRLVETRDKLARTVRINESARRRRQKLNLL